MLELRFGLIDGKDHTLEEVSRYFNVTRERIRQIEAKALRKLRHPTRSRYLKEYLVNANKSGNYLQVSPSASRRLMTFNLFPSASVIHPGSRG